MEKQIILDTTKIPYYLEKGKFHKDWYSYEPNQLLILLPEFEGLPIIRCFAVTSMTTSIEANVHLAIKALLAIKRNQPFIGFLPAQITYLNLIHEGKDVPGRKIMSFIKALEGDPNAVAVDIWMCKAFGILKERTLSRKGVNGRRIGSYYKAPSKLEYKTIEDYCRNHSLYLGLEPRQYQSMIWAAIKQELGFSTNVSWSTLLMKKRGMFQYE